MRSGGTHYLTCFQFSGLCLSSLNDSPYVKLFRPNAGTRAMHPFAASILLYDLIVHAIYLISTDDADYPHAV